MNPIGNWLRRHSDPASFWLHITGIPACFVAAPACLATGDWPLAVALFVAGYALQLIGHLVVGDRSGEEMLLRRLLSGSKR